MTDTATKTPAERFYDAWFVLSTAEDELDEALLRAFGADYENTESWPCGDLRYDCYDASFELHGTRNDFNPTPEQLAAVWPLGFAQGWICFNDGTEIFVSPKVHGERKPSRYGASEVKRLQRQAPCRKCRSIG